jgi:hypothetical protein
VRYLEPISPIRLAEGEITMPPEIEEQEGTQEEKSLAKDKSRSIRSKDVKITASAA